MVDVIASYCDRVAGIVDANVTVTGDFKSHDVNVVALIFPSCIWSATGVSGRVPFVAAAHNVSRPFFLGDELYSRVCGTALLGRDRFAVESRHDVHYRAWHCLIGGVLNGTPWTRLRSIVGIASTRRNVIVTATPSIGRCSAVYQGKRARPPTVDQE